MDNGKPRPTDRLISITDTTLFLGVGRTMVYKLIGQHKFKSVRIEGRRLVHLGSLLNFIAELSESGEELEDDAS